MSMANDFATPEDEVFIDDGERPPTKGIEWYFDIGIVVPIPVEIAGHIESRIRPTDFVGIKNCMFNLLSCDEARFFLLFFVMMQQRPLLSSK